MALDLPFFDSWIKVDELIGSNHRKNNLDLTFVDLPPFARESPVIYWSSHIEAVGPGRAVDAITRIGRVQSGPLMIVSIPTRIVRHVSEAISNSEGSRLSLLSNMEWEGDGGVYEYTNQRDDIKNAPDGNKTIIWFGWVWIVATRKIVPQVGPVYIAETTQYQPHKAKTQSDAN